MSCFACDICRNNRIEYPARIRRQIAEDPQMADAADDRDLVAKSVRPVGPQAIPPRSGAAMRRLADLTYPLRPNGESRCLSVGRGITLSGEVNSCDKLLIEGNVDAKLCCGAYPERRLARRGSGRSGSVAGARRGHPPC